MFEDDIGRLQLIGEWVEGLREVLTSTSAFTSELLLFRLSRIQQASAHLTAAYRAAHPEIERLGLPTMDEAIAEPSPRPEQTKELARRAIAVFSPLVADPPDELPPKSRDINPASRIDEVMAALGEMEPHLRTQGLAALYLFGSTARREDGPNSDVDLAFEITQAARECFSLLDQASIRRSLEERLGVSVDLVFMDGLRDSVLKRVWTDGCRVFDERPA